MPLRLHYFMIIGLLFLASCSVDNIDAPNGIPLNFSFTLDRVAEGEGAVSLVFEMNEPAPEDVIITFAFGGSALVNLDYQIDVSSVTIEQGQSSFTAVIQIVDDNDVEGEETITAFITSIASTVEVSFPEIILSLPLLDNDSFPFENGYFVLNEGVFFQGNASISFVNSDFTSSRNSIFGQQNSSALGDVAQSMAFKEDFAFIVINNSQKIEVVNRHTMESITTIDSGFLNPRYMAVVDNMGYVTNWGDGTNANDDYLAVVDLESYEVISNIPVAEGPERILANDGKLFVAHQGGFGQNNKVSVVDTSNNSVVEITVGDVPNSMQFDNNGDLWVLCGGNPSFTGKETAGSLLRINPINNSVLSTLTFETTEHPSSLGVQDANLIYYLGGKVYNQPLASDVLTKNPLITEVSFYDMSVINGLVLGLDAKSFTEDGSLVVYNATSGSFVASTSVGIIPGEVYYNPLVSR